MNFPEILCSDFGMNPEIRKWIRRNLSVVYCAFAEALQVVTQKSSVSKILEVVSRPEFARDYGSGLRSDRGPIVLWDFSKSIFKFVWEILRIQPTIQTWGKHFSKIGSRGTTWNCHINGTTRADFWKNFSASRKKWGYDAFEKNPSFINKDTVLNFTLAEWEFCSTNSLVSTKFSTMSTYT
jgi:hypothetical protein